MDFNLSQGDNLWQFHPYVFSHRWVRIFESNDTFLGRSWITKGYEYGDYPNYESEEWAANFGRCYGKPIQAQFKLNDSIITYDHGYYPVISFTPISQISTNSFSANFSVKHYYSRWNPGGSPGSFIYIESVMIIGFYEKGDSIYKVSPVAATIGYDYQCTLNFLLDLELLKRQYTFKYKIQAKDKGLLPHYTIAPDTGYYSLVFVDSLTNVIDDNEPYNFTLSQNYPNPFNPSAKIRFTIPSTDSPLLGGDDGLSASGGCGYVTLKVYDVLGNEIATLVDEEKPAGSYEVEFANVGMRHASSNTKVLPSGVYFYQLKIGASSGSGQVFVETKKMILLR